MNLLEKIFSLIDNKIFPESKFAIQDSSIFVARYFFDKMIVFEKPMLVETYNDFHSNSEICTNEYHYNNHTFFYTYTSQPNEYCVFSGKDITCSTVQVLSHCGDGITHFAPSKVPSNFSIFADSIFTITPFDGLGYDTFYDKMPLHNVHFPVKFGDGEFIKPDVYIHE